MLNKVILMGRLTRDPELKNTNSGIPMCRFSVAVERRFADKTTGERTADFLDCTAFKGTAEFVSRYFTKGSMILVEGSVQNNHFTDNNGVKHYNCNIMVDNVSFCGGKNDQSGAGQTETTHYDPVQPEPAQSSQAKSDGLPDTSQFEEVLTNGDVPF